MSGLVKAKKYDWKDSNMALFGTDVEKGVKKESAETEKAWHGCGQKTGLRVWRVNKFQIEAWPEEDYGKFYEGDSYIILNTYTEGDSDELLYDVHFWIGKYSTQDEYGTAAYKTVELDTFLDDKPIQHREVEGHESKLFKSYFKTFMTMKGGADSGFRRVTFEEYPTRLLHFSKKGTKVEMKEIERKRRLLSDNDVYILDKGMELVQWNGAKCNPNEKYEAASTMNKLKTERLGRGEVQTRIYEQNELSPDHRFYNAFDQDDDDDDDDDDQQEELEEGSLNLVRVTDDDGSIGMEEVAEDDRQLTPDDVYLVHTPKQLYVWVGANASIEERRNGLSYGHKYLSERNSYLSIAVVSQGQEPSYFKSDVDLPIAA